ncbi:MAG: endonuclease III [Bacteroidota bacterium]|nr:endonuclease III [Bacteroidota bacterium]
MTRHQKAAHIQRILDQYIPEIHIPLIHHNAYTLLISVLLSAQCTDERVNKVTPILFNHADNAKDMALLDVQLIESIIKPCGLYKTKARAISKLSEILMTEYKGQVPNEWEALEALPGVGHKTASVVMSQVFGVAAFPVDTHIHRLAKRWGLSSGKNVKTTEIDMKKLFPESSWNKLHLQIIFFGRQYCPARNHDGLKCPICSIYGKGK